jgi:uncharacterized protein (TIGR02996 family)
VADRKDFLKAIKAEPTNYLHRYVYADWLDEHGEHEEADRQRNYEAAEKWLTAFADRFENDDESWRVDLQWLLDRGREAVKDDGFMNVGDRMDVQDAMYEDGVLKQFWRCWSVVAGKPVPPDFHERTSVGCAC